MSEALDAVHEVGPLAAKRADESERLGYLSDEVVEALHETQLFRVLVPDDLGGVGLTLPESVEVFRQMSTYDASTGWVLSIVGDGPLFGRFLSQPVFEEMFGDRRATLAVSLYPLTGRAEPVPGGFRFSGSAPYASGCRHATWLMAGAWVYRDGQPSMVDGRPEMIAGIMAMAEAKIQDTWSVSGMRATGSNDCTFDNVVVPEARTFEWPEPAARFDAGPFVRVPLLVQLGGGIAAAIVGVARGALGQFLELAASKHPTGSMAVLAERAYAQMAVGEAEGLLLAAEDTLAGAAQDMWARAERSEPFDVATRVQLRLRSVTATRLAIRAVDLLHDAAGMNGVMMPSALERAWRDVHTASQHVVLSVARLEVGGRVLLGLDPGSPVIGPRRASERHRSIAASTPRCGPALDHRRPCRRKPRMRDSGARCSN